MKPMALLWWISFAVLYDDSSLDFLRWILTRFYTLSLLFFIPGYQPLLTSAYAFLLTCINPTWPLVDNLYAMCHSYVSLFFSLSMRNCSFR